jgi:hypothetical protein
MQGRGFLFLENVLKTTSFRIAGAMTVYPGMSLVRLSLIQPL